MRKFYNRNFLVLEFLLPIIAVAALSLAKTRFSFDILSYIPQRTSLYSTLAAVLGALLGFVITGVSVILAFGETGKLDLLKKSPHYGQIYGVYISSAKILALSTVAAFLGLILDTHYSPGPYWAYVTLALLLISMFRLYRCIWVLENVTRIVIPKGR